MSGVTPQRVFESLIPPERRQLAIGYETAMQVLHLGTAVMRCPRRGRGKGAGNGKCANTDAIDEQP